MNCCYATCLVVGSMILSFTVSNAKADDLSEYFHHKGPLAGTLKSDAPLPIYDADPQHLWNRMYAAFYIRPRMLPATEDLPTMVRYEGGDVIEFLAMALSSPVSASRHVATPSSLVM